MGDGGSSICGGLAAPQGPPAFAPLRGAGALRRPSGARAIARTQGVRGSRCSPRGEFTGYSLY